jgi:uncharacterized protein (UPF0248 family)
LKIFEILNLVRFSPTSEKGFKKQKRGWYFIVIKKRENEVGVLTAKTNGGEKEKGTLKDKTKSS